MCEISPGPRCASRTCEDAERARAIYTAAYPDGPAIGALERAEALMTLDEAEVAADAFARAFDDLFPEPRGGSLQDLDADPVVSFEATQAMLTELCDRDSVPLGQFLVERDAAFGVGAPIVERAHGVAVTRAREALSDALAREARAPQSRSAALAVAAARVELARADAASATRVT